MSRLLIASAAALALSACQWGSESKDRDVGESASRTYQVGEFNKIEVAGPYNVEVVTGQKVGVAATGGANLLDETEVTVENGTLKIAPKKRNGFRWSWNGGSATFTIATANLNGLALAGSGDGKVDKVTGDFEGAIAGSGSINVGQIEGGKVSISIAGAGDAKLAGKADSTKVDIAGSGDVDAGSLIAKTAEVSIAGSGDVKVHASESADVSIMGAGDVDVAGGGKCSTSKAGSGNVTCH